MLHTAPHPATAVAAEMVDGTKVYGTDDAGVRALDGVSLAIPSAQWTAIMGPSGSGKSTLLHCMAGLDQLTSGRVEIGGHDLADLDDDALTELRRERVGFVFQSFNLVPTLTAAENVALPFTLGGRRPDRGRIGELLAMVGLVGRAGHRPGQLSGGQQQRVAVARALAVEPAVVFADEPTGNLDSRTGAEVLALLRRTVDEHAQSLVMVTHDAAAAAWADAVVFIADGRVVDHLRAPTAETVLDRMKSLGA